MLCSQKSVFVLVCFGFSFLFFCLFPLSCLLEHEIDLILHLVCKHLVILWIPLCLPCLRHIALVKKILKNIQYTKLLPQHIPNTYYQHIAFSDLLGKQYFSPLLSKHSKTQFYMVEGTSQVLSPLLLSLP